LNKIGTFVITFAIVFEAGAAGALEAGQCGPIAEIGASLAREGQSAFAKGDRMSTPDEMKASEIGAPVVYGLIYFTNDSFSRGYIAKTDRPLPQGPSQMCIDHVIGNIEIADARTKSSQVAFERSSMLAAYLAALEEPAKEYVMFQATLLKKTASAYSPGGTIVTATGNFVNQAFEYKGGGTIFFTNSTTGGTSKIYKTGDMAYTKHGSDLLVMRKK
jgi:hypothetical protein